MENLRKCSINNQCLYYLLAQIFTLSYFGIFLLSLTIICLFSQRSILLDCETQIERLLATVFENYKSLDENSPTGLTDHFGLASHSAAPALHPALQVYSILHDILSSDAQTILQNYLQVIFM